MNSKYYSPSEMSVVKVCFYANKKQSYKKDVLMHVIATTRPPTGSRTGFQLVLQSFPSTLCACTTFHLPDFVTLPPWLTIMHVQLIVSKQRRCTTTGNAELGPWASVQKSIQGVQCLLFLTLISCVHYLFSIFLNKQF